MEDTKEKRNLTVTESYYATLLVLFVQRKQIRGSGIDKKDAPPGSHRHHEWEHEPHQTFRATAFYTAPFPFTIQYETF